MPNNNHNPILRQAVRLVLLYLALVLAGTLAKPLFVLAQPAAVSGSTGWSGIGQAMLHGLLLDVATAGYLIAPVWLLCGLGLWVRLRGWRVAYKVWPLWWEPPWHWCWWAMPVCMAFGTPNSTPRCGTIWHSPRARCKV